MAYHPGNTDLDLPQTSTVNTTGPGGTPENIEQTGDAKGAIPTVAVIAGSVGFVVLLAVIIVIVGLVRRKRNASRKSDENVDTSNYDQIVVAVPGDRSVDYDEIDVESNSAVRQERPGSEYVDVYEEVGTFRRFIQRLTGRGDSRRKSRVPRNEVKRLIQKFERGDVDKERGDTIDCKTDEQPETGESKSDKRTAKFPPVPKAKSPSPKQPVHLAVPSFTDTGGTNSSNLCKTPPPVAPKPPSPKLLASTNAPEKSKPLANKTNISNPVKDGNKCANVSPLQNQKFPKTPVPPSADPGATQKNQNLKPTNMATGLAPGKLLTVDNGNTAKKFSKSDSCLTAGEGSAEKHEYENGDQVIKRSRLHASDKKDEHEKLDTVQGYIVMDHGRNGREGRSTDTTMYDYAYAVRLVPRTLSDSNMQYSDPHEYLELIP